MLLAEGIPMTIFLLGTLFWATLAFDRFFEPGIVWRIVLLTAVLSTLVVLLWRNLLAPLFTPLDEDRLALSLERQVPELNESLITAVQLLRDHRARQETHPLLLARSVEAACRHLEQVSLRRLFRYRRAGWWTTIAVAMAATVLSFVFMHFQAAELWAKRVLLFSDQKWPRATRLVVEGFDENGVMKVARGDELTLEVKADLEMPRVPEIVEIHPRTVDRALPPVRMVRTGQVQPGADRYVRFLYTFPELLDSLELEIRGGDAVVSGLRIEVVEPPVLSELELACRYPEYMNLPDRTITPTGMTAIARGTQVTLLATSNRPLAEAVMTFDGNERVLFSDRRSDSSEPPSSPARSFQAELGVIEKDQVIQMQLTDPNGIANRQPIRLVLSVREDEIPQITSKLRGIGSAITPVATLPVEGKATDDYGLARLWFEYQWHRPTPTNAPEAEDSASEEPSDGENQTPIAPQDHAGELLIAEREDAPLELPLSADFPVESLALEPGDRLTVAIAASDHYNLEQEPHRGRGDRYALEVVTPARLKGMLEAREIVLRQRFESLILDVRRSRSLVDEIGDLPEPQSETDKEEEEQEADAKTEETEESESAESEEAPDPVSEDITVQGLRISRSLRDTKKEAFETRATAESFLGIRDEMINNRIYSDEVKQRLEVQIVQPLQQIAEEEFPELDKRLHRLRDTLDDASLRKESRKACLDQIDLILQKMETIREQMVEMESFHEVIELLRSIIERQEALREDTSEEKKEKLRDLLDL